MRKRIEWLAAGLLLLVAGCAAGTKPCMIIPAQIELASDVRDAARGRMEDQKANLSRMKLNVEQSQTRLARLTEERDMLKKEVGGTPAEEAKP